MSQQGKRHIRNARNMALLAQNLADAIELAVNTVEQRAGAMDGIPSAQTYDGMPRGSGSQLGGSPHVESQALARAQMIRDVEQLLDDTSQISVLISDATSLAAKLTGKVSAPKLLCSGGLGQPGWKDWGDHECSRLGDPELCAAHRLKRYRWRKATGRDDVEDVQPA
jgi:hypothetical protein